MSHRHINLGFPHPPVCEGDHICLIYRNEEERRSMVSDYIRSGLEANEMVVTVSDTMTPDEFGAIIQEHGVNPRDYEQALMLLDAAPTYCPEGTFVSENTLAGFQAMYDGAIAAGFKGMRGTGEMTWALDKNKVSMETLMDFESDLNVLMTKTPVTCFCQYDVNRFDGATLFEVMAVHPKMIVGGQLMNNPMYINPTDRAANKCAHDKAA